jgi:hypothetical protein
MNTDNMRHCCAQSQPYRSELAGRSKHCWPSVTSRVPDGLVEPLRATLSDIAQLFESDSQFDPASAKLTWHITSADYSEQAVRLRVLPSVSPIGTLAALSVAITQPTYGGDASAMGRAKLTRETRNFPGSSVIGMCPECSNHTNRFAGACTLANHSAATSEFAL